MCAFDFSLTNAECVIYIDTIVMVIEAIDKMERERCKFTRFLGIKFADNIWRDALLPYRISSSNGGLLVDWLPA